MPKVAEQDIYPLNVQKPELIQIFRKKTKVAILVLSISYLAGIVFFILLYLHNSEYCYLVLLLPLFGYIWLVTFGSMYVNNHYGFRRISGESMIYLKTKYSYSTYTAVFAVIFLISSLIRLILEIRNYVLIKQTISSQKQLSND